MGRHKGSRNKPKHKGLLMESTIIAPIHNHHSRLTTVVSNQPKIVDKKSDKHFGLLLSTQQSVEEFQKKSGMLKAFTTEYQYHYWALVARIKVEDEVLDIAIPTVMFNYNQKVSGAAVDFHLNDVEAASNKNAPIAEAIAGVLIASSFGQYLQTTFGSTLEWMNIPMNTCHVHPGSLSTFSGTDYKKDINDPGIVFPLSEPQEQTSFSSIICHSSDKHLAKVVRTEYRFANRDGLDINYAHGTCLAYWKGYTIPGYTIPGSKTKLPLIKAIFANKQYDEVPDKVVPEEVKNGYVNTDGTNTIVLEANETIRAIIGEFDKLDFSPHTEDITADRFTKPTYGSGSYWKNDSYYGKNSAQTTQATTYSKPATVVHMTIHELRTALVDAGYAYAEVAGYDWYKCNGLYQQIKALEEQLPSKTKSKLTTDMSIDEMIKYMLNNGVSQHLIKGKSVLELEIMFEDLIEDMEEGTKKPFDAKAVEPAQLSLNSTAKAAADVNFSQNTNVRTMLMRYGLSAETIDTLSNDDISILIEELSI